MTSSADNRTDQIDPAPDGKESTVFLRGDDGETVTLEDLFAADATPEDLVRHRRRTLGGLVGRLFGIAMLSGLLVAGIALPSTVAVGAVAMKGADFWNNLPAELPSTAAPQRSVILASDNSKIAEFYSENRVNVPLAQVPQTVRDALISIEDSRFYSHGGVDWKGILRAVKNNATGGDTQGASTLEQQYVKNILLLSATTDAQRNEVAGQSYVRKIKEAKYALTLEKTRTKDQILEGYLNIAYFGDGVYGVGTAAQHYFSRDVSDLTLAQAALLAGLVKNPAGYDPATNPQRATDRRNIVLDRMLTLGKIAREQHDQAVTEPLALHLSTPANGCATSPYPFYCEWVKKTIAGDPAFGATQEAREQRLYLGGMIVRTALDPHAQQIAQAALDRAIPRASRVATASVTVQPGTGRVVAMAVNRGYGSGEGQTQLLLPVLPAYQPGSTMKAFTLAAALENGWSLSTRMDAPGRYTPANMAAPAGGFANDDFSGAGNVDAATATARSLNTWFVKLEERVGVLTVADMAARLGITSLPRTGPNAITPRDASLTLGTYEVSPLEIAAAFATFAAHGVACRPVGITATTDLDGKTGPAPDPRCHQAIAPGIADTVASVLQGVIDGPEPYRTGAKQSLGRPAGAKTGTTDNSAAVWFTGFTAQYATSVWVGDPRGGQKYPLKNFEAYGRHVALAWGGETSGPIWRDIMANLHAGLPVVALPGVDPTVATGLAYTTPDVRGLDRDQAITALQSAGYIVKINPKTAPADPLLGGPDRVAMTDPVPGTHTTLGATITLTLTAGSRTDVTVPPGPGG